MLFPAPAGARPIGEVPQGTFCRLTITRSGCKRKHGLGGRICVLKAWFPRGAHMVPRKRELQTLRSYGEARCIRTPAAGEPPGKPQAGKRAWHRRPRCLLRWKCSLDGPPFLLDGESMPRQNPTVDMSCIGCDLRSCLVLSGQSSGLPARISTHC